MNLLLDIGNTSLRWSLRVPGEPPAPAVAVRHGGGLPPDLLAAWENLSAPTRILASQVGDPGLRRTLNLVARALWGLEPEYACVRSEACGVRIAYADPSRLGVDRWLALIAAQVGIGATVPETGTAGTIGASGTIGTTGTAGLADTARGATAAGAADGGSPTLILDAGTAATFDLLLADGEHLGGLILPGLAAQKRALLAGARLPPSESAALGPELADPEALAVGRDTGAAIDLGGIQALAALATRLYDRLAARAGAPPRFLLTGGDAESLRPALDRPCLPVPDLVLRGLAHLADADVR